MWTKNCLLCANQCTQKWSKADDGILIINRNKPPRADADEDDPLANQLRVIFLLRKVLEIPPEICCTFLENYGDPCSWIHMCDVCLVSVRKGKSIFMQMMMLQNQFKTLQNKIKNEVIQTAAANKNLIDDVKLGVTETILSFINQQVSKATDIILPYQPSSLHQNATQSTSSTVATCGINEQNPDIIKEEVNFDNNFEEDDPLRFAESEIGSSVDTLSDLDMKEETNSYGQGQSEFNSDVHIESVTPYSREKQQILEESSSGEKFGNRRTRSGKRDKNIKRKDAQSKTCNDPHGGTEPHGKNFHLHRHLNKHRKGHASDTKKPCKCKFCGKEFTFRAQLVRHERTHTGEKPYMCDICGNGFSRSSQLSEHKRIHTGEKPYKCDTCGKAFNQLGNLNQHKKIHTGEKPYICETCGKAFSFQNNLQKHKKTHKGEKPHKCSSCDKCFVNPRNLKIHERTHTGERPFQCEICGKSFANPDYLVLHKKIHTQDKHFQCKVCGKCFVTSGTLKNHEASHADERPFSCDICKKGFSTKGHLKSHLIIHTGEKPHKCESCGKAFADLHYLNRHKKIHTGEKPHQCSICDKRFTVKSKLIVHERRHAGEKPFKCEICEKSFVDYSSLAVHKKRHAEK